MFKEPNNKDKTSEIECKIKENESSFKCDGDINFWNSAAAICVYQSNKIENINHTIEETTEMIQNFIGNGTSLDSGALKTRDHTTLCGIERSVSFFTKT
ncbi:hypothetical protein DDB_G0283105 [Dictyostelium discoideum AX4]|uniref:hypothetical protein n=1 Tax=Dictyostelium discoideum AX4 TaxID=352472 RepID=UPI00004E43FD|nr:hypothetical protein DDB_G0283105 [Dictyostelium discoideum AX4]EAL65882.1 hypothetical protein DDB_G0283105 [Dictyostelium discoideum AX4]|eukprot:XP_639240.1 hypothetical protein DDB_G0283105 [Dictyostelium discoideum AX4]